MRLYAIGLTVESVPALINFSYSRHNVVFKRPIPIPFVYGFEVPRFTTYKSLPLPAHDPGEEVILNPY